MAFDEDEIGFYSEAEEDSQAELDDLDEEMHENEGDEKPERKARKVPSVPRAKLDADR